MKISKWISIIERSSLQYRNNSFKDIGLSGAHHMYLFYLCKNPGVSQEELVQEMQINKSNVARAIKILANTGFVVIENNNNDKRMNKVYPTNKAYNVLPIIKEKLNIWNDYLLYNINNQDQIKLIQMLEQIALKAKKYGDVK